MAGSRRAVIDMHAHGFSRAAKELVDRHYTAADIVGPDRDTYMFWAHPDARSYDMQQIPLVMPKLVSLEARAADMDRQRVDMQVISPIPFQYYYWTDPSLGAALARLQNDEIAALAASNDRFAAMAALPLQDAQASVGELRRCVLEHGIRAFIISSWIDGVELSDRRFDPVWEEAVRHKASLFVHPVGFNDGSRLIPHFMHNAVGQPLEEQIAITHLIFGGVLDRHPGIRFVIAHGGGYFPYYVGRMDHAWEVRPELRKQIARRPSEYLRELWYDTVVFRPDALEYLVNLAGADKVMLGTDYPFDMAEADPVGLIEKTNFSMAERAKICGGTIADLLGLD